MRRGEENQRQGGGELFKGLITIYTPANGSPKNLPGSSLEASGIWMAAISGLFGEGDLDGDREAGRTGLDEEEAVEF